MDLFPWLLDPPTDRSLPSEDERALEALAGRDFCWEHRRWYERGGPRWCCDPQGDILRLARAILLPVRQSMLQKDG